MSAYKTTQYNAEDRNIQLLFIYLFILGAVKV